MVLFVAISPIVVLKTAILPLRHPIKDLANIATQKFGENPNINIENAVPANPHNKIGFLPYLSDAFPIGHNIKIEQMQMKQINNQNIWLYQRRMGQYRNHES